MKKEQVKGQAARMTQAMAAFTTAMNGISLPDSLKALTTPLTATFKDIMSKLETLSTGEGDTDSDMLALNALTSLHDYMTNSASQVSALLQSFASELRLKDVALNSLREGEPAKIEAAIAAQINEGKLMKKEVATELIKNARTEGRDLALNSIRIVSTRRTALTEAKLPLPADEALLEGEDAVFTARKDKAATRVAALAAKGFTATNSLKTVTMMAWLPADADFDRQLAVIEEARGSAKVADPLRGGAGGKGAKAIV